MSTNPEKRIADRTYTKFEITIAFEVGVPYKVSDVAQMIAEENNIELSNVTVKGLS